MTKARSRRWTDRDGTDWEILWGPAVELDPKNAADSRERLVFRSEDERIEAPAAYGSALETLGDDDLQGLLDGARTTRDGERSAWEGATLTPERRAAGEDA